MRPSVLMANHGGFRPTRFIDVRGVKIAVYESDGRGPGALFIHGNTSSAGSFEKVFASQLAREHRFVALDLPGYGQSENAQAYSIDLFSSAIAAVARETGASVLVGWSLGGDLALQARHKLPGLKGIFVFGTVPVGRDATLPPPFVSPQQSYAGETVTFGTRANLTPEQVRAYVTAFFRPQYQPIPEHLFEAAMRTDPGTRAAVLRAALFQDPDFRDEVTLTRDLDIPLAIVHPDQDVFVNLEMLSALAPSLPTLWRGGVQIVRNSGHAIHWEHTDHFLELVDAFVGSVTSKGIDATG